MGFNGELEEGVDDLDVGGLMGVVGDDFFSHHSDEVDVPPLQLVSVVFGGDAERIVGGCCGEEDTVGVFDRDWGGDVFRGLGD